MLICQQLIKIYLKNAMMTAKEMHSNKSKAWHATKMPIPNKTWDAELDCNVVTPVTPVMHLFMKEFVSKQYYAGGKKMKEKHTSAEPSSSEPHSSPPSPSPTPCELFEIYRWKDCLIDMIVPPFWTHLLAVTIMPSGQNIINLWPLFTITFYKEYINVTLLTKD